MKVGARSEVGALDVVIVNWNAGLQLSRCLRALATTAAEDGVRLGTVVVVDNGSVDGSASDLAEPRLPLRVERNSANRGFAAACNQGAALCDASNILFLNPDTELHPGCLRRPLDFLDTAAAQSVGVVGIQSIDERGDVWRSCARFPQPSSMLAYSLGLDRLFPRIFAGLFMSEWDHASSRRVDHVIGAFYLVRRALFDQLRGFDEQFFVYMEDLDFSRRAHLAGWNSYFLAEATLFHKGGGTSERIKARRLFYSLRSRLLYVRKHFGAGSTLLIWLSTLMVEPGIRVLHAIALPHERMREVAIAYRMLWAALPAMLKGHGK